MKSPSVGEYVLATKYADGDCNDPWAVGFYDGTHGTDDRHFVKDGSGKQFRMNGFRRVKRIRPECGKWLVEVMRPELERFRPNASVWGLIKNQAWERR